MKVDNEKKGNIVKEDNNEEGKRYWRTRDPKDEIEKPLLSFHSLIKSLSAGIEIEDSLSFSLLFSF